MRCRLLSPRILAASASCAALLAALVVFTAAEETPLPASSSASSFPSDIRPLIEKHCLRCHNADNFESGIRVDQISDVLEERQIPLLLGLSRVLADHAMPPEDEPQPSDEERARLTVWLSESVTALRKRDTQRNGSARRLTVSQYRNTLRDLLGLREDLTDTLPPDAISKDGFANNGQAMVLSPLQVETYFEIAEAALDRCLVDETQKPVIETFRMDFGASLNKEPCPDSLILGANSELLGNADFVVTELQPHKPFGYEPFRMPTTLKYIEGYVGNDTIREWRTFNGIYHSVFACVRGTPGYPKGDAFELAPAGLLLRPSIPSEEIFGQSNTYGPMANFKISLRDLPDHGDFRVTVKASRYDDGLLPDDGFAIANEADSITQTIVELNDGSAATVFLPDAGVYQVDLRIAPGAAAHTTLDLDGRRLSRKLPEIKAEQADSALAYALIRLPAGEAKCEIQSGTRIVKSLVLSRLKDESPAAQRFIAFEKRLPTLGVHVGLRRDCGSTLTQVGETVAVAGGEPATFTFEGAINDYPSPDVEKDNVNYLAGLREIGVRHEYTDGRDIPRLQIHSIEFEGPYYDSWPPATHRAILIESKNAPDSEDYAREVVHHFATRAFRRPVSTDEEELFLNVWRRSSSQGRGFRQSIKDALTVVLTSPQFLFLIESSNGPQAEDLDEWELASKLSYFLWNTSPDARLQELVAAGALHESLDAEFDRMVHDRRFSQAVAEFASQWLSLDKFDVVAVDINKFPALSRETRKQLRQEPIAFIKHLIQSNRPLRDLVQCDYVLANDVVARYYGLADKAETGLEFAPLVHHNPNLGGVLTEAAILAGLSNGRESNPIKRGAWLARKIIAEPPDDPPPNVPKLQEDDGSKLTLREKLERHRNQKGCVRCHTGIDPWGIPMETMNAAGLPKDDAALDTRSTLPDGAAVSDLNALRAHLADERIDSVAFSFAKHIAVYACGRSLSYNELEFLRQHVTELKSAGYPAAEIIRFVIHSDLFLKK